MKFVLLASSHNEGGKTYKKGDRIETEIDLVAVFGKDKFRRAGVKYVEVEDEEDEEEEELGEEEEKPAKKLAAKAAVEKKGGKKPAAKKAKVEEETEEDEDDSDKVESKLGDDVTSKHPRAKDADLIVLKKGKKLFVADKDEPDTALNEDPIHTDEELSEFLDGFAKPE